MILLSKGFCGQSLRWLATSMHVLQVLSLREEAIKPVLTRSEDEVLENGGGTLE